MPDATRSVYFDYAATTPVDDRVIEAMLPYLSTHYGNPNSLYALGRDAYRALEDARERVARGIGATHPNEVLFTGCGTESDNAAIIGITTRKAPTGGHIVVSAFEHHAILEPAEALEKRGYAVTLLKPREDGIIHPDDLAEVMRDSTVLVSVMHGNNEIGTVQPIRELADIAHGAGALMHTDAAQTLGKVRFNAEELGVDAASFSGHKIYAPKGVGVLYLKRGTPFDPLMKGGGQEFKKRSGTQNVAGAVAFARALELTLEDFDGERQRLFGLRKRLVDGVIAALPHVEESAQAPDHARMPNISSLLIKGVEGESMLLQLDNQGISVSTGSACSSGSLEPSHVLLSIGIPPEIAHGSLRVSMGRFTTAEDVEYFLDVFPPIVERLRAMSPVYARMFGEKE